jgi:hypothetical protein
LASPPRATTGEHPASSNAAATQVAIGRPSTSIRAFVRPIRRLAPPVSTTPGGPPGSPDRSLGRDTARIELQEERVATLGLVGFTDLGSHVAEPSQRP